MRSLSTILGILLIATLLVPNEPALAEGLCIGMPDMATSFVDAHGGLHEDWGVVSLQLVLPENAAVQNQDYDRAETPTVVTTIAAGPVTLRQTVYRAPIWPEGVDVFAASLQNTADAETPVTLRVALPEQVDVGERVGVVGGRAVIALPEGVEPIRNRRDWGCAGGVAALPGWGKPAKPCDPAFANIRAGMGGVPIIYRFKVPQGAQRTVVLGICESHWGVPGKRPVLYYVEGAPRMEVDPIAKWGQHVPACLRFDARDVNNDGELEIVAAPHPNASDRNPILNAVWIFCPDVFVDVDKVRSGSMSPTAECYVDAGGDKDQSLFEPGKLDYELTLQPNETKNLLFMVANPGSSVPNPENTAWNSESLRKAAVDVWQGHLARDPDVQLPEPKGTT